MERNGQTLIVALLCVLAISLASATLTNPQQASGPGEGGLGFGPSEEGNASQLSSGTTENEGKSPIFESKPDILKMGLPCVSLLASPASGAVFLGFGILLALLVYRRVIPLGAGVALSAAILFVVPALLLLTGGCFSNTTTFKKGERAPRFEFINQSSQPAAGGATNTETVFSTPLLLGAVIMLMLIVMIAFIAYRSSSSDTADNDDQNSPPHANDDEAVLSAVGTVAGETADRIETGMSIDNEVYRAWKELTTHLDVQNPDVSTPAEFATAAEDAGMDSTHIEELTELFRDVRYGGAKPTADREERATTALRTIEAHYANDEEA